MHVTAIVVAAGEGSRLKSRIPKPLVKIDSEPLIIYSLRVLSRHPLVKEIIVVANPLNYPDIAKIIGQYKISKIRDMVLGGSRRQDSVYNGLTAIRPQTDLVLVHDGARPFIDAKIVSLLIKAAKLYGAAIVGVPVAATIKEVYKPQPVVRKKVLVKKTLNRESLWEIQTPQVFKKDLILTAYKKFKNLKVTDDAMLVEKMGKKVSIVLGSAHNIKITTPEDLIIAKAILKWKTV